MASRPIGTCRGGTFCTCAAPILGLSFGPESAYYPAETGRYFTGSISMPTDSTPLLLSRRFAPLFWTQFFSAFSDNFLKNALVFLILFSPDIGRSAAESLITLAA